MSLTIKEIELHKRKMTKYGRRCDPSVIASRLVRYMPGLSYLTRMHFDALPRPDLAYGTYLAAFQAKALGLPAISVIEFGVASGDGLVCLERHAKALGNEIGIEIEVCGFDRASGLFETDDVRDIVFWFRPGEFKVQQEKVQSRLTSARYIVGEIAETLPKFVTSGAAPVGFISVDVDYYTSTMDCFRLFEEASSSRLPRVLIYLDDIIGNSDLMIMGERLGQLAAVDDWNAAHRQCPITKVTGLEWKRPLRKHWNDQFYCLHDFAHPSYNSSVFAL